MVFTDHIENNMAFVFDKVIKNLFDFDIFKYFYLGSLTAFSENFLDFNCAIQMLNFT